MPTFYCCQNGQLLYQPTCQKCIAQKCQQTIVDEVLCHPVRKFPVCLESIPLQSESTQPYLEEGEVERDGVSGHDEEEGGGRDGRRGHAVPAVTAPHGGLDGTAAGKL